MAAPPRFLGSVYDVYPDNDTDKEVFLQAAGLTYSGTGDRHVLICWSNSPTIATDPTSAAQVIQLTGQAGNHSYYAPVALTTAISPQQNLQISLGTFSRAQRDQMLELAKTTAFVKSSVVNGCRVWTRDLFARMVEVGLMSQELFVDAERGVPLVKRRPEVDPHSPALT